MWRLPHITDHFVRDPVFLFCLNIIQSRVLIHIRPFGRLLLRIGKPQLLLEPQNSKFLPTQGLAFFILAHCRQLIQGPRAGASLRSFQQRSLQALSLCGLGIIEFLVLLCLLDLEFYEIFIVLLLEGTLACVRVDPVFRPASASIQNEWKCNCTWVAGAVEFQTCAACAIRMEWLLPKQAAVVARM